jgi:hypothetical protein
LCETSQLITNNFSFKHGVSIGDGGCVERTSDVQPGFVENVRVNHCRGDVPVAEQFLDSANIITSFEKVGGETMAEGVATGGFWYASRRNSQFA